MIFSADSVHSKTIMGCVIGKKINDTDIEANINAKLHHLPPVKSSGIQDDARSFRSKVGAIKMLSRSEQSFSAFQKFLETDGFAPFLVCFRDMEEIKKLAEDQMISRTAALIWRYKVIYENVKVLGQKPENNEYLIWDCLGKLRQIDIANAPASLIMKYLLIAENEILARLVRPFESFLHSPQYKSWQDTLLEQEKMREKQSRVYRTSPKSTGVTNANSGRSVGTLTPHGQSSTPNMKESGNDTVSVNSANNSGRLISTNPATCSDIYPDILIVDDSLVTLKLTGLTLEKDGHHVERAHNGQVALQLMKSRPYDVVLIDINMPVMDGFETVRLFREFERNNNHLSSPSDDLSSISSSEGDFSRKDLSQKREEGEEEAAGGVDNSNRTNYNMGSKLASYELNYRKPNLTAAHYHQLIIGISTNIDEETRTKAMEAGMDYFLAKPFTLQKFIETIRMSRMSNQQRQASLSEGEPGTEHEKVPSGLSPLNSNPMSGSNPSSGVSLSGSTCVPAVSGAPLPSGDSTLPPDVHIGSRTTG